MPPAPVSAPAAVATSVVAAPVVTFINGQVSGEQLPDGSVVYRGIPYAKPPVALRRWKAPEAADPWSGVRDGLKSGPPCLQAPLGWNNKDAVRSQEDCLYLDVRAPSSSFTGRKPVMVWIHGGANWAGSGSGAITSNIVQRGVVLVTFQYRLGIFGFLSHPALSAESKQKASGNYALLDQIAALQWVKANIAKVGGDPNNVTIFGHSAGGQDVGLLMLSPLAKGLFAKAIQQSGTAGFGLPARTLAENEKLGEQFAALVGIPAGTPAPLDKLRAMYSTQLLAAGNRLDVPGLEDDSFIWLQPVVDGYVLPRAPADLLNERKQAAVPLIIGSAAREFPLYGGPEKAQRTVQVAYGANADKVLPLYGLDKLTLPPEDPRLGDVGTQVASDINFRCPVAVVSRLHQAAGARVWQYQIDRPAPDADGVVKHGAELLYVLNGLPLTGRVALAAPPAEVKPPNLFNTSSRQPAPAAAAVPPPAPAQLLPPAPQSMQAYWVRFAMTGDPNGPGLPRWPEYTRKREYLEFTDAGAIAKRDLRVPFCDLLNLP